jgi:hypothetical protein
VRRAEERWQRQEQEWEQAEEGEWTEACMEMVEGCGSLGSASVSVRRRPTVSSSKKGSSEYPGNRGGLGEATCVLSLAWETGAAGAGV